MSTLITIAEEQRQPLLLDPSPDGNEEEIAASSSSNGPDAPKLTLDDSNQRLLSLDVFRGLTVALMILVDDAGGAFPSINHAPWFGVTIADFVMPFFLFCVGVSISLVFKKSSSKTLATKKVILRTIKLFLLGLFLQGGYFHGRDNLTYGVDVVKIRWLGVLQSALQIQTACRGSPTVHCLCCPWGLAIGIVFGWAACWPASLSAWPCGVAYLPACCLACLHGWPVSLAPPVQQRGFSSEPSHLVHPRALCMQRISIGYLLASISEIWLVYNVVVDCPTAFVRKYHVQWIVAALLLSFYMCLLYGLYVPNWEFQAPSLNLSTNGSHTQIVHCGVRGSLEPPCNAVGYIDQYFLGEQHLYQRPVYRRTKECSVNSPDYGPLPPDSPEWCLAPFDPEGILSSLMAVLTCFVGLHFGHVLLHYKGQMQRALLWSMSSFLLLVSGFGLEMLGIPLSKPLYTLSYMCITAGASGLFLTIIFYIVDVKHFRKPVVLLQWMGMNALIVYALAACDIFPAAVQGFYWRSPENNLVDGMESLLQAMLHSSKWGTLVFVLLQILFWCLVAGFLHMKGIYIKL
ncbi:PREDICTED: heparan-alpha-glucosaminide N-acetyltransferase isoform X3 [Theobroma cacao]|uniref:Heparan-alpha-glucosaminide N-acetyltransferase isoform X3 n=1 Tax=Theobroma cacao TaxID=3641 RepID=A0AB32VQ60_THECC|nr:PREDICTED: heparan-alpha-glucosaminide N-acetyltransferase isoform X3 [Theobroma cacao]